MATIPSRAPLARTTLRLFDDEALPDEPPELAGNGGDLSGDLTLTQLFERWFAPVVLLGEGAEEPTIRSYRESLAWWARITGDPTIWRTTDETVAKFKIGLREATWRRGVRGPLRPLSEFTVNKHCKNVRAVLRRAGPTLHPDRPGKNLVSEVPHIRVSKPRSTPKPSIPVARANEILAAARRMPTAIAARWILPPAVWWRGLILVLYYTGLRIGTTLKLRYHMIELRDGNAWLIVPGSIVDKTSKPLDKFLHPIAHAWLLRMMAEAKAKPGDLIFPWPHCKRWLNARHERVQILAGIPEALQLSPHAWRRTHGMEMARVGARQSIVIAQRALDHADERTTRESYVDIEPELIRALPRIDELASRYDGPRQLDLF